MIEIMPVLSRVIPVLIGTILGGLITWSINRDQKRIQTTFDFHREFDSNILHNSRIKASKFIKENPNLSLNEITQKYTEESFYIWQIIKFYRRLRVAIKYNQVKTELIPKLFGENFIGWYNNYFETKYIKNEEYKKTQGCEDIKELEKWFHKHSSECEMHKWIEYAEYTKTP